MTQQSILNRKASAAAQLPNYRGELSATTSLRGPLYAVLMAGMIAGAPATAQAIDKNATPQGGKVAGGKADFDRPANNKLNVNQESDRAVINWESFDIGENAKTQFKQPGSGSLAVNRVTGGGNDPSKILGQLTANGKLMVLDRNGVFFGKNAVVDTNGIIASTGDVSTSAVMSGSGEIELSDFGDAAVTNKGRIDVGQAGLAAFVAPTVNNSGVINASLGKVAFAAGEKVTVDLYGDKLVEIAVDDKLEDALLENKGTINAAGGQVTMTTQVAKQVVDNVINMEGVTRVASVEQKGGKIVLKGGENGNVRVAGEMDASGKTGSGGIEVTGRNVEVAEKTILRADATYKGDGGTVNVIGINNAFYQGFISARGGPEGGDGGDVEVSGYETLGYHGSVDLRAPEGMAGSLLLDPRFTIIHSGFIPGDLQQYVISADTLADNLQNAGAVTVQADEFIDVGTKHDGYNTGNAWLDSTLETALGTGPINLSEYDFWNYNYPFYHEGTTQGTLNLISDKVNFNKDLTMGTGGVSVDTDIVNLASRIYDHNNNILAAGKLSGNAGTVNVLSNNARIQQGINFADSGSVVNVESGTYTENVTLNVANMKFNGIGNPTIKSPNESKAPITVTASGVNVDPVTVDANGADYGLVATGADADGLVVDGNTFKNAAVAGIKIENLLGGTSTVKYNTFEGSATRGVEIAGLSGSATVNIENNQFGGTVDGEDLGRLTNGVLASGGINNASVNITDSNNITASSDGIIVDGALDNADFEVKRNTIDAYAHGVNIPEAVRNNATVDISDNPDITAGHNGVNMTGGVQNADVTISGNNDGIFADSTGVFIEGDLGDDATFEIADNNIYAGEGETDDGIHIVHTGEERSDAELTISGNQIGRQADEDQNIAAKDGAGDDGIEIDEVNGGVVESNDIYNVGDTGIYLTHADDTRVGDNLDTDNANEKNTISNAGAGIFVKNSDDVKIYRNDIDDITGPNVPGDGIRLENGQNADIHDNTIHNIGDEGIFAGRGNINGLVISANEINSTGEETGGSGNGIELFRARGQATIGGEDSSDGNIITDAGFQGIWVKDPRGGDSTGFTVKNNEIAGADRNGILIGGHGDTVSDNIISDTGIDGVDGQQNGIQVNDSPDVVIEENHVGFIVNDDDDKVPGDVDNIRGKGIYVNGSDRADIINNDVTQTESHGILVNPSFGVDTTDNRIAFVGGDGIRVEGGGDIDIDGNKVLAVGGDGIFATNVGVDESSDSERLPQVYEGERPPQTLDGESERASYGLRITDNEVVLTGGHGIGVESAGPTRIANNKVFVTGVQSIGPDSGVQERIDVDSGELPRLVEDGDFVQEPVPGRALVNLDNERGDGIHATGVNRFVGEDEPALKINGNDVGYTGGHGIYAGDSGRTAIGMSEEKGNRVDYAGVEQARVTLTPDDASGLLRELGDVFGMGEGGMVAPSETGATDYVSINDFIVGERDSLVDGLADLIVEGEIISRTDGDGIHGYNLPSLNVTGNTVNNSGDEGIDVTDSTSVTISRNTVTNNTNDGIELDDSHDVTISNNDKISDNGTAGIDVTDNTGDLIIKDNATIDNNGDDGIEIAGADHVELLINSITGSDDDGVDVNDVTSADTLILTGNTVTGANANGIVFSNITNTRLTDNTVENNGANGIYAEGSGNGSIKFTDNSLTDNTTGMRFESGTVDLDGIGDQANTITGGENGIVMDNSDGDADVFGFAGNRLGNTVFSGQSGDYVSLEGGTLFRPGTPTVINGINASYDGLRPADLPTPGVFGDPNDLAAIEAKLFDFDDPGDRGQIFAGTTFDLNDEDVINDFNVITGPNGGIRVTINGVNLPGGGAANLAAIEPAAGGDGEKDGEGVAGIEPAAGGGEQTTPCTNTGTSVTQNVSYNLGGSREQLLSDTAQCANAGEQQ